MEEVEKVFASRLLLSELCCTALAQLPRALLHPSLTMMLSQSGPQVTLIWAVPQMRLPQVAVCLPSPPLRLRGPKGIGRWFS